MKKITDFVSDHIIITALILLWIKTIIVTFIGFDLTIVSVLDVVLILLSPIGILMLILGFSFLIGKRVRPIVFFSIIVLITALLYANLLYYRFYIDFVTVSVLLQLNNVGGLGSSTAELISPFDILLFIDLFFFGWILMRTKKEVRFITKPAKRKYIWTSLGLIAFSLGISFMQNPYLLEAEYDREQLVKSLGIYNYQLLNSAFGVKAPIEKAMAGPSDVIKVDNYMQQKEVTNNELFGMAKGKNVVLISMESTQNFVINQKVNGEEITPFLNDLIKESFYFSNVYDQTAQGKTSDAEFMIDSGMYPLASGSVFVRRPDNVFNTLPQILKNASDYSVASFHGNDRNFWNREEMYQSLGYDRFFSKRDYDVTEENSVNYGIKDIPFFEQSMEKLSSLEEPYMAKFITLTNHFPFLLDEGDRTFEPANTEVGVVNQYVTTVHYQDQALKRFFQMIKEQDMYEDTIFVLYGDHYGISEKYEKGVHELLKQENTLPNHMELQQVPLIIHVPGQDGKVISTVGGQIDIRATLLQLLGIPSNDLVSFSHDLFTREGEPVIFRDGSMLTEDYLYAGHLCFDRNTEEQVSRDHCLTYQDTVRERLDLSDRIILGDLLRFME